MRLHRFGAGVVLALAVAVMAAGNASAAAPAKASAAAGSSRTADNAPDAARMWQQFLATADDSAYEAFDALDAVGYDQDAVDPALCREHAAELKAAVAQAPVSIAVRRAAFLCADAINDDAAAEREMAALLALSRHALEQASSSHAAKPIRVLVPMDVFALLASSGLTARYEYYEQQHATRYFPFVVMAWDDTAKVERRYRFDFIDTAYELSDGEFKGYPLQRDVMADAFIEGGVKGELLAAMDVAAVKAAIDEDAPADKVAKLRRTASAGGVQSSMSWLMVCYTNPVYRDCANGLIDALLPEAEAQHAMHLMMLAYAHLEGIGVKRDATAAWAMLDAADRVSRSDVLGEFASLWTLAHPKQAWPSELTTRMQRARANGHAQARLLLIAQQVLGKEQLAESELAFLAAREQNQMGMGDAVLAEYYHLQGRPKEASDAMAKAAGEGSTLAQVDYARLLLFGGKGVTRDVMRGELLMSEAAHGGSAIAARIMAERSALRGDYAAAERWLLPPATAADLAAILELAHLYSEERPGVASKADRAVAIYTSLAAGDEEGAPARRALAQLALEGRGMDKDARKAQRWLQSDAGRGDHESEALLGIHYLTGSFGKVDEVEGERWIQKAMKGRNETAYLGYGQWLYAKNTAASRERALATWVQGDQAGFASSTNGYAWALCTSAYEDYNPARGLEAAKRLGNTDELSLARLDTVAACYAATGDFKRAAELQAKVVKRVAASERTDFESRLALYKAGKSFREEAQP